MKLRDEKGFSLIEVLVTIVLVSVTLSALATLSASIIRGSQQSQHVTGSITLMQDKIEEFKNTAYASIATGYETGIKMDGTAGGPYGRAWTITTVGDAKQVDVTVTWPFNGVTRTRTMTTIIGQ